ncbi:MAG: ABC transporter ATP-binding protein [Myxococcales bacterium]|nr:ABC transporter ATP-binding protein [Myxococcales bacterium]
MQTLWARLAPYSGRLWWGVFLLLLTNGLEKTVPMLIQRAVDALRDSELEALQTWALAVVGFALTMAVVRTASRIRIFNVGRDLEFDLRNELLRKLQRLGPSFFARMPTGETMSRAINDLAQVRAMVAFGLLNLVNSFLAYAIALVFMLGMSVELTLWALLPYPLVILSARWVGNAMYTRSRGAQEALGELAARVQETLSGIRVVRAFGIEPEQERIFERANQTALERNMSLVIIRGFMWPLLMGVGSLGTLLVLWRGTALVRDDVITVGELVAFLAYGELLRWPTMGLGYILSVIQRGRASWARILEVLEAEPDVIEREGAHPPRRVGDVVVKGLDFAFGQKQVLDDVSLRVPAGSSLAIMGRTGSGKSTLAALMPRLLATPPGSVYLDGDDVTDLQLRPLRRAVGYAQQDPFLFSNSIARNIGYRFDDPSAPEAMERIRAAAREASVLDEIEALPAGFATMVGERGVQLSGGQKQRIALARALLNEPTVLIMDDPLSAVDAKTESHILDALERAGEGRTVILITNRVAAAARCQDVLVLDDGRVVEHGSSEELLEAGGLYAQLAARQRLEQELSAL